MADFAKRIGQLGDPIAWIDNPKKQISTLKQGKALVETQLKIAGILLKGTDEERKESLDFVKNTCGEEFIKPLQNL